MRNIINTTGLSLAGFGIAYFFFALMDMFFLDGLESGYRMMEFLFPYHITDQLTTLSVMIVVFALSLTPRT